MLENIIAFFNDRLFMPHGHCYFWQTDILLLHVLSDILTSFAYYFVAISIVYFTYRYKDLPKKTINLLIGTFIVFAACGTVHMLAAITVWYPIYWIDGSVKLVNMLASWYVFAFMLVPLIPAALRAPSHAQLEAANQALQQEMLARERVTKQLQETLVEVESYNSKLLESIQYAKLIQTALLPNLEEMQRCLPYHFLIWKPKDIVGGDMVYVERFEDYLLVAVLDCTGHGVPGAFMTMIATTCLKRITKDEKQYQPDIILQRLNFLVKTSLQQDSNRTHFDNGLDAACCLIDLPKKTLTFSSARIPLHYVVNKELNMIKGDKVSLGYKNSDTEFNFTRHTISLYEDTYFYLTTDGFIDQIGGENGFPLGNKQFRELLMRNYIYRSEKQHEIFWQFFQEYQGHNSRLDDVTLIGFGF